MTDKANLVSNDNTDLAPITQFDGSKLEFDFPALKIGVAEYDEGPTGCTVFCFPEGASTKVDRRGSMIGAIEDDYGWHHALCFAGGSLMGLEAAMGVRAELFARGGYSRNFPLVSGAIIWDWHGRDNAVYPDKALGQAAAQTAQTGVFPLGPRGAGRSAGVGSVVDGRYAEPCGQGGAFLQVGPTKILVFSVVNALGAIVNRQGDVVRGNRDPDSGEHFAYGDKLQEMIDGQSTEGESSLGNTTLTLLVTNQKIDDWGFTQLPRQVHGSMARAIQPFHTKLDGDIFYAVTTKEVENKDLNAIHLGGLASELAWDAVLSSFQTPV